MANIVLMKYAIDNRERRWKVQRVPYTPPKFHEHLLWSTNTKIEKKYDRGFYPSPVNGIRWRRIANLYEIVEIKLLVSRGHKKICDIVVLWYVQ